MLREAKLHRGGGRQALHFASTVVIADFQDHLGSAVAASVGDKCSYMHCDVTDEKQVEALVSHAVAAHGRLNVLFSNAGVMPAMPSGVLDMDIAELDRVMAVNVRGAACTVKHAARVMVAGGTRGSIVCTASVAASVGGLSAAAYTASKHAVLGLVRGAAGELGKHGVRINCVSPFRVGTPLACRYSGATPAQVKESCCALACLKGVMLKPSHIAEAALFFASDDDESAFVTGHNLVVDGGFTVSPINFP
ncbi:hypothetical protein Taro_044144 [Colocasia esculenta]|uniref:Uncharacterized protein n=1 Tax=Colocasia esculenta TaxID=4460 RepID=A0A843WMZ0_COLES|nr:hypothetical protein [Colocasia esculenta]